jgi:alpha-ketoglutarate-dependent taurine dioxygenase
MKSLPSRSQVQRMLSSRETVTTKTDPRAWRAETIDDSRAWYYPLSDRCLAALEQSLAELRRNPQPVTSLRVTEQQRAACHEAMQPVREALEAGRGFAIIERVPVERLTTTESQAIYWLVGQLLGEPFEQNVQGTLLYDVRDTGQDVSQGARFSVTSYESSFHTDNSFGESVLDYVGLLCLHTAKSGGRSQILSGYAVDSVFRAECPDVLETLRQPFHVDRRGGTRDGEAPTIRFPIIEQTGRDLLVRYLRYWIEVGHQKASEPLTAQQARALDTLDDVLRRPELRAEFDLRPGQMYFINNRWTLHNRTAFEDYVEPDRRRHLVRLWLKARG